MRIGNSKKFKIQGLKFEIQRLELFFNFKDQSLNFKKLKSGEVRNNDILKAYKQHSISRIL